MLTFPGHFHSEFLVQLGANDASRVPTLSGVALVHLAVYHPCAAHAQVTYNFTGYCMFLGRYGTWHTDMAAYVVFQRATVDGGRVAAMRSGTTCRRYER